MLALAHHVEILVAEGRLPDYAAAARILGLTRARMTQVLNLLLLAPDLQARVLGLDAFDGARLRAERALRVVMRVGTWTEQRKAWRALAT